MVLYNNHGDNVYKEYWLFNWSTKIRSAVMFLWHMRLALWLCGFSLMNCSIINLCVVNNELMTGWRYLEECLKMTVGRLEYYFNRTITKPSLTKMEIFCADVQAQWTHFRSLFCKGYVAWERSLLLKVWNPVIKSRSLKLEDFFGLLASIRVCSYILFRKIKWIYLSFLSCLSPTSKI